MSAIPCRPACQSTSNTSSSSKTGQEFIASSASSARGQVILVDEFTTTRSTKRARTSASALPRRTNAHLQPPSSTLQRKSIPLPKRPRDPHNTTPTRRDADEDDNSEGSNASSDDGVQSTLKTMRANAANSFVHRNAFDSYFAVSKPCQTSNNVFSQLVPSLTLDDYNILLENCNAASKNIVDIEQTHQSQEALFPRYALELAEGFNLLFFGFGSKFALLNTFAQKVCTKRGHVAIVNGYLPHVGIKDVLSGIEQVPGLVNVPLFPGSIDMQTRRIYNFFLPPAARPNHLTSMRPLFLIIHNIDSPALRGSKAKAALSYLALNPRIHIIASVDHVHAPMIWSTAEASARKHSYGEGESADVPPTRGFAWVWHDMTTMQPYEAELAHVDLNKVGKANGKTAAAGQEQAMTETAAQHILASVNSKAKKLFALLANTQLAFLEESGNKEKQGQQMRQLAVSYDALFNAARADFIATNDTSFKALLAEFRDHKLIMSTTGGGGESLWIPLRAKELIRVVASLLE